MWRSSGWMVAGAGPGSPCSQQLLAGSDWAQPQPRVPAPRAGEAPAPGPARPAACAAAAACAALPIAACVIPALTGAGRGPISGGPEPSAHGPAAAAAREGLGPALGAPGRASAAQWGSTGAAAGQQWGWRPPARPRLSGARGAALPLRPAVRAGPSSAPQTFASSQSLPGHQEPSPFLPRSLRPIARHRALGQPGSARRCQGPDPRGRPSTRSLAALSPSALPHTPLQGHHCPTEPKPQPEHHLPRPLHLHAAREAGAGASAAAAPS